MKVARKIEPNSREQSEDGSRQERESGAVGVWTGSRGSEGHWQKVARGSRDLEASDAKGCKQGSYFCSREPDNTEMVVDFGSSCMIRAGDEAS